ncbi:hypothetical protein PENTCL1PPCAC_29415, partial [Pristionchus entomophagus]
DKEFFRQQKIGENYVRIWRDCCAFDFGFSYYTAVPLPNHQGVIEHNVWIDSNWIATYVPNTTEPIRWELTQVEAFRID